MKLVKKNIRDVFLPSDPTFRVSMQKWGKHCTLDFFVLIKGIYEIVQANDRYLQKVNTMSFFLLRLDPLHILVLKIWQSKTMWLLKNYQKN